eukprot:CAMPEP_0117673940 /NCGR_PEP_ID=MMETSP0804-20121206/14759_1 /TAXON_ID=1074897 /ORGANISM="Tetraselmis astigmatica, Strain CCMP880" /LENGTH=173 /DNA_ID=CAMNT_0005482749 /DNA_START=89 /DNA_END=610 /DNA_ORIENTATION=+
MATCGCPSRGSLPIVALLLALALSPQRTTALEDKSRGFNSDINWLSLDDVKALDLTSNTKPLLYLVSQPWCGACKRLKGEFTGSGGNLIEDLSKSFIMVGVSGDTSTQAELAPEGAAYVPRMLFAEANGKIRTDLKNKIGNPKYPFFYSSGTEVLSGMKAALKVLGTTRPSEL